MRCPACDKPNDPEAAFCSKCGAKLAKARHAAREIEVEADDEQPVPHSRRRVADEEDDRPRARRRARDDEDDDEPGAVASIIPYRNTPALSSYYLGIFSLIP